MFVAVLSKFLYPTWWHRPLMEDESTKTYMKP